MMQNPKQPPWLDECRAPNGKQVRDNFRAWFGASRIVDDSGEPLVVFHGTKAGFDRFDLKHFGASDEGLVGRGSYFTYNRDEASGYALNEQYGRGDAPNVQPVYIAMSNPFMITHGVLPDGRSVSDLHRSHGGINRSTGSSIRALAEEGGHDGIVFASRDGAVRHVIAWKPEQIKSAIGNSGTFDPSDPDTADRRRAEAAKNLLYVARTNQHLHRHAL
ncbi:MAG: hypothetical protein JWN04_4472 [Myxococcaceae bacterium]|nr:hypothetical protein [Myxococcaceae bacterium]